MKTTLVRLRSDGNLIQVSVLSHHRISTLVLVRAPIGVASPADPDTALLEV